MYIHLITTFKFFFVNHFAKPYLFLPTSRSWVIFIAFMTYKMQKSIQGSMCTVCINTWSHLYELVGHPILKPMALIGSVLLIILRL